MFKCLRKRIRTVWSRLRRPLDVKTYTCPLNEAALQFSVLVGLRISPEMRRFKIILLGNCLFP